MTPFPPPSPSEYLWLRIPKRLIRILGISLLLLVAVPAVFHQALLGAAGDWLVKKERCEQADLVIVLAGDRGDRLDHALALYRRKAAPRLLMSGGPIVGTATWAEIMRDQAVRQGVPAEDIWIQDRSVTTEEDALFCAAILADHPEIRTLCLVTSNYHSRRSLWLFQRALAGRGIVLISDPVVPAFWKEKPWWKSDLGRLLVFNEYVKLSWSRLFGAEF